MSSDQLDRFWCSCVLPLMGLLVAAFLWEIAAAGPQRLFGGQDLPSPLYSLELWLFNVLGGG